jgi:tetratricopeptide (TPR) repeat protein
VTPERPHAPLEGAADRVALAAILDASGRYEEAAAVLGDALAVYERVLGPEHYELAGVLLALAGVAEHAGESERAAALRARAQRIRRRVVGHTYGSAP